jgi:hypothetical protein
MGLEGFLELGTRRFLGHLRQGAKNLLLGEIYICSSTWEEVPRTGAQQHELGALVQAAKDRVVDEMPPFCASSRPT